MPALSAIEQKDFTLNVKLIHGLIRSTDKNFWHAVLIDVGTAATVCPNPEYGFVGAGLCKENNREPSAPLKANASPCDRFVPTSLYGAPTRTSGIPS
jgi:hypothetical protein